MYKNPDSNPAAELITIVSGSLGNGMGDKFDAKKGCVLKAGASFALPAKHAHYVWTTDQPTVLELVASGPWGLEYIDPADDPRNKKSNPGVRDLLACCVGANGTQ